jgi:hypothetical protein
MNEAMSAQLPNGDDRKTMSTPTPEIKTFDQGIRFLNPCCEETAKTNPEKLSYVTSPEHVKRGQAPTKPSLLVCPLCAKEIQSQNEYSNSTIIPLTPATPRDLTTYNARLAIVNPFLKKNNCPTLPKKNPGVLQYEKAFGHKGSPSCNQADENRLR